MAQQLPDGVNEQQLAQWIVASLAENKNFLSSGLQGQTLIYKDSQPQLVIKIPHGRALMCWLNKRTLQHEYDIYQRLQGFAAVPRCYGMIDQQYLAIEYIPGQAIRHQRPINEGIYFARLLEDIKQLHDHGVAHMDLKKRDNLMVTDIDLPCIIDFGAAVVYKPGFHPFNHFWYALAQQFDYNAWFVHKYRDQPEDIITDIDRAYFKRTLTERVSHKIKRFYKDHLRYIFKRRGRS